MKTLSYARRTYFKKSTKPYNVLYIATLPDPNNCTAVFKIAKSRKCDHRTIWPYEKGLGCGQLKLEPVSRYTYIS